MTTATKKASNKRQRTNHIGLRLTPGEEAAIRAHAEHLGYKSAPEFLRRAALHFVRKGTDPGDA